MFCRNWRESDWRRGSCVEVGVLEREDCSRVSKCCLHSIRVRSVMGQEHTRQQPE